MTEDGQETKSVVAFDEENAMFKGRDPIANVQIGKQVWIYFADGSHCTPDEVKKIAAEFKKNNPK